MKNYFAFIALLLSTLLFSCKKEAEKPKVIYNDTTSETKQQLVVDTTLLKIADLPINMEGTNYLLFPVGVVKKSNSKSNFESSSYKEEDSFIVSNYGEYQITGRLDNIKFQEIGKDTIYSLTDKKVLIQTATYLKQLADKSKKQLLVYTLEDIDTNKDDTLDTDDILSLYISDISGKNFTKLTADFQELIDWNYVVANATIYFRTIEDTNKNGKFDKKDTLHYFRIHLLDKDIKIKPIEYKLD
jgi:hypothetical protein